MTDEGLKKILGFVLRNKGMISSILDNFKPEDIERGIVSISADLINKDYKMYVMEKGKPFLNDFYVLFDRGYIFLDLDVNAKQLGRIKAKYMLSIYDFVFNESIREIYINYKEDVHPEGNFVQNMALKAAGLKGNYIQTAIEMSKLDYIKCDKDKFFINLNKIDAIKKVPSSVILNYLDCDNGTLRLKFNIV